MLLCGVRIMPKQRSEMKVPDPFVMNEDCVNHSIAEFLIAKGFQHVKYLTGKQKGIDVEGEKDGWVLHVESEGSHAIEHNEDTVFGTKQIKTHTYVQIGKLMECKNKSNGNILLALANPDIPRIRSRVNKVSLSLDMLGFIRLWVQEDKTVKIEYPKQLQDCLSELGLIYINYT